MSNDRTRKRAEIAAAATAAIAAAAVPLVTADTAAASPPPYCPGNTLCLYEGPNFDTTIGYFANGDNDGNYNNGNRFVNGDPLNDRVHSVWNNTNQYVVFCYDAGCPGGHATACVDPGAAARNISSGLSAHIFTPSLDNLGGSFHCSFRVSTPKGCSI
jgi:hypothetical protein